MKNIELDRVAMGKRLDEERHAFGLTQENLGEILGIEDRQVRRLLKGQSPIMADQMYLLWKYGIDVAYITFGERIPEYLMRRALSVMSDEEFHIAESKIHDTEFCSCQEKQLAVIKELIDYGWLHRTEKTLREVDVEIAFNIHGEIAPYHSLDHYILD